MTREGYGLEKDFLFGTGHTTKNSESEVELRAIQMEHGQSESGGRCGERMQTSDKSGKGMIQSAHSSLVSQLLSSSQSTDKTEIEGWPYYDSLSVVMNAP